MAGIFENFIVNAIASGVFFNIAPWHFFTGYKINAGYLLRNWIMIPTGTSLLQNEAVQQKKIKIARETKNVK